MIAHGTGLDEFAIFFFPAAFGLGFWLLTRKKPDEDEASAEAAGAGGATIGPRARKDGAARLHDAMDQAVVPTSVRKRPKDGAAKLRAAMRAAHDGETRVQPRVRQPRMTGPERLNALMRGDDPDDDLSFVEDSSG